MLLTFILFISLENVRESNVLRGWRAEKPKYCPGWQESFVCVQETERTNGPLEQRSVLSRDQSQTMTFFCLRESAENTKTCQSNTDDSGLFIQNTSRPHTLNS